MVGQYLPQTNEKCYSVLQCPMCASLFPPSKHSHGGKHLQRKTPQFYSSLILSPFLPKQLPHTLILSLPPCPLGQCRAKSGGYRPSPPDSSGILPLAPPPPQAPSQLPLVSPAPRSGIAAPPPSSIRAARAPQRPVVELGSPPRPMTCCIPHPSASAPHSSTTGTGGRPGRARQRPVRQASGMAAIPHAAFLSSIIPWRGGQRSCRTIAWRMAHFDLT
jgi:hypothetical protein